MCGFHAHKTTWDLFLRSSRSSSIDPYHAELSVCPYFNFTFCCHFRKYNHFEKSHPPAPKCFCGNTAQLQTDNNPESRGGRMQFYCPNYFIDGAQPKCTYNLSATNVPFDRSENYIHPIKRCGPTLESVSFETDDDAQTNQYNLMKPTKEQDISQFVLRHPSGNSNTTGPRNGGCHNLTYHSNSNRRRDQNYWHISNNSRHQSSHFERSRSYNNDGYNDFPEKYQTHEGRTNSDRPRSNYPASHDCFLREGSSRHRNDSSRRSDYRNDSSRRPDYRNDSSRQPDYRNEYRNDPSRRQDYRNEYRNDYSRQPDYRNEYRNDYSRQPDYRNEYRNDPSRRPDYRNEYRSDSLRRSGNDSSRRPSYRNDSSRRSDYRNDSSSIASSGRTSRKHSTFTLDEDQKVYSWDTNKQDLYDSYKESSYGNRTRYDKTFNDYNIQHAKEHRQSETRPSKNNTQNSKERRRIEPEESLGNGYEKDIVETSVFAEDPQINRKNKASQDPPEGFTKGLSISIPPSKKEVAVFNMFSQSRAAFISREKPFFSFDNQNRETEEKEKALFRNKILEDGRRQILKELNDYKTCVLNDSRKVHHLQKERDEEQKLRQNCQKRNIEYETKINGLTEEIKDLKEELNKEKEEKLPTNVKCRVCYEETITHAMIPCYHLVMCAKCIEHVDRCCVCRKPKEDTVRIYFG